jgi:tRNA(Ile)-lysidine synthase
MKFSVEQEISHSLDELDRRTERGTLDGKVVLAAVSGGADSVALLLLLHRLSSRYGYRLHAITVNHLIRSEAESSGDALFVKSLCASLLPSVPCSLVSLAPGEVLQTAAVRGRGVEEAARFLRYQRFDSEADRLGALWVFTGHNRNDRNETTLMRFFQGAVGGSLAGIRFRRGKYARPLLGATHADLIAWLRLNGFSWRDDATNADDAYLRNKIRLHLVPFLEAHLPGWERGLEAGIKKSLIDEDLCRSLIRTSWQRSGSRISCSLSDYAEMHPAVRLRFLRDGLELLCVDHRVPGGYLLSLATADPNKGLHLAGSGLVFQIQGDRIFLGSDIVQNNKSGYLVYILSTGKFQTPCGSLAFSGEPSRVYLDGRLGPFALPLIVRSRLGGDMIETADGKQKTLKKILNEWSIPESERNLVPVIEVGGKIRAVYGSLFGYPDWYVQT